MALFVTSVTFDLAQILVTLHLVFFDSLGVTAIDDNIGGLVLLIFAVETEILFGLT